MYVIKRCGRTEPVAFDKITERLRNLSGDLQHVDAVLVAQKVVAGVYPGVRTTELDELAAETAAALSTVHPQYHQLAGRVAVTNLHKCTRASFARTVLDSLAPVMNARFLEFVRSCADELDAIPQHERDLHAFDLFGFRTLEKSYLMRDPQTRAVAERPQHMWLRVAIAVELGGDDEQKLDEGEGEGEGDSGSEQRNEVLLQRNEVLLQRNEVLLQRVRETYDLLSRGAYTHATPTLFNAGMVKQQMSSCFLLQMQSDSIEGIYDTLKQCACISKYAGGIGLAVHCIRATRSLIHSTQGRSNGLVPMLRVFNETARYVDQGGGKRKGAFAIYIEPWHADIFEVLLLKKNQGAEHERARDLFYALWTPDLFMQRVQSDGDWTLFDPGSAPGLHEVHGDAFNELYARYEREGRGVRTVKAQLLWRAILTSQEETGTPYMLFKDACNLKSNHQHLGTIQSSNLCTEVLEYTSRDEIAVCNLASISLPHYVVDELDVGVAVSAESDSSKATTWRRVRTAPPFAWRLELAREDADRVNWRECDVPVTVETVTAGNDDVSVAAAASAAAAARLSLRAQSYAAVQGALHALGLHVRSERVVDTEPPRFVRIGIAFHGLSVDDDQEVAVELRRLAGDAFAFARVGAALRRLLERDADNDAESLRAALDSDGPCVFSVEPLAPTDATGDECATDLASIYYIDDRAVLLSTRPFALRLTTPTFDFARLHAVAQRVAVNLDRVIDGNFYPLPEAARSNRRHRPIGIGVQGFADVLARMMLPFESSAAAALNRAIFETIYHAAACASVARARLLGAYPTYAGSPSSRGLLQYHLWNAQPTATASQLDWRALERDLAAHGLRNSLLVAPMPTASTAQILGNNESFEPYMSNVFTRRVLAGEFTVVNKHLVNTLVRRGLWTPRLRERLIATKGSVQPLTELPADIRAVFKTVWEIPHKVVMNHAVARGPFVCQSQSLNAHIADVTYEKLTSMHFYAWRNGLKTGMYYLRTRPKADAIAFTVDPALQRSLASAASSPASSSASSSGAAAAAAAAAAADETECTTCSA